MTEWKIPVAKDCDNMKYSVHLRKEETGPRRVQYIAYSKKSFCKAMKWDEE